MDLPCAKLVTKFRGTKISETCVVSRGYELMIEKENINKDMYKEPLRALSRKMTHDYLGGNQEIY